ncbi:MAG: helix-turn-helix domain-containing protein [Paracoccaceae bacterium]|nr:helix-turn-helix domain-containing protein [Paracoccaceae bacterium]
MDHNDMTFDQLCELFGYEPKRRPLDAREAAALLGVHPSTLEGYRLRGGGPRFFNPPRTRVVRYAERDLLAWLVASARSSTSEALSA